ncbi:MAG: hypothetical protein NC402_01555 [Prevotella sp.]|nr:hypothetical protein [Prevotella sp.]MCM1074551.1 hypothetical protein [Ruminococcus sp.]
MILAVILVLLIWALWFFGPQIRRWAMRRTANYVQDRMFKSMGIDPSEVRRQAAEAENESRRRERRARTSRTSRTSYSRRRTYGRASKIIPREYGDAVTFEVLQISGKEKWLFDTEKSPVNYNYKNEFQISDAKYTVISE